MSRIYEALKLLQRDRARSATTAAHKGTRAAAGDSSLPERRGSLRKELRVPVFVYGRSAQGIPFHEEAEMSCVNAGGGMTALSAAVAPGQELLLVHLKTQQERPCRVVYAGMRQGAKFHIAVALPGSEMDFWEPAE